jgi:hypothetical protein
MLNFIIYTPLSAVLIPVFIIILFLLATTSLSEVGKILNIKRHFQSKFPPKDN